MFYAYVRTQFSCPIKAFQTDNGREFDNTANRTLFNSNGTILRLTCPYTSQQNGKAERII
jgi:histone deacetylase 1/2